MLVILALIALCSPIYGKHLLKIFFFRRSIGGNNYRFYKGFRGGERIIGGEGTDILEVPWQAGLLRKTGNIFPLACGGTVIQTKYVLTSASCINGTVEGLWRVRVGSPYMDYNGQQYGVNKLFVHENFGKTDNPFDYDIGLVRLFYAIDLKDPESPVRLISLPVQNQTVDDGTFGVISGWGSLEEGGEFNQYLRKVDVQVVNQKLCADSYGNNLVTDRMVCLGDFENGGVGSCSGDGGGPFAVDGYVVGIASWGIGCGRPGYPGVYTRVASYKDWIVDKIEMD